MGFDDVKPLPLEPSREFETKRVLHRLVANASLEAVVRDIVRHPALLASLEAGTEVFVPFPPRGTWDETLAACRLIQTNGCCPVPHVPARMVRDRSQLIEWIKSLETVNVRSVMLIAGDVDTVSPCYKDSLEVLSTKILTTHGIEHVSVAAYPDGHPQISTIGLEEAFNRKQEFAIRDGFTLRVVTQFGFDAEPLLSWLAGIRGSGMNIPISVGVAARAQMKTLLLYAARCGVRHSIDGFLANPSVARMLGQWDPLKVLGPVSDYLSSVENIPVEKAHIFTFGGLQRTIEWRARVLAQCDEIEARVAHE